MAFTPYNSVSEREGRKQATQHSGLLSQVEAGKGLEMRKLVLSGFLASEEIYINQLEALLLVSTRSDGHGHAPNCFRSQKERGPEPAAGVIASKGPRPSAPALHHPPRERREQRPHEVGSGQRSITHDHGTRVTSLSVQVGSAHHFHPGPWEGSAPPANHTETFVSAGPGPPSCLR